MSIKHYNFDTSDLYGYTVGGRWTHFVTGDAFTSLAADTTSTVAMISSTSVPGGVLSLDASGTNNNEVAVYGTHKGFLFGTGNALYMRQCFQFTELASNAGNVALGFADASGGATLADLLLDDGAGPHGSIASCVMLYKVDGGTVWKAYAKCNSLTDSADSVVVPGGSDYKDFEIRVTCDTASSGGLLQASFAIDNIPLMDTKGRPITLKLAYASAVTMKPFLYAKTGGSVAIQVLSKYFKAGTSNRAFA